MSFAKHFFHIVIFQFRGCFNKFVLGQPQSEWISVLKGLSKSIENRVFHRFFWFINICQSRYMSQLEAYYPRFRQTQKRA